MFCHEGECEPCQQIVKKPCYCGKSSKGFKCCDLSGKSQTRGYYSCSKKCGKPLPNCRHYCQQTCHEGECDVVCKEEVKVVCPCGKRVEKQFCNIVQQMKNYDIAKPVQIVLECNEGCTTIPQRNVIQPTVNEPVQPISECKNNKNSMWIVLALVVLLVAIVIGVYLSKYSCLFKCSIGQLFNCSIGQQTHKHKKQ